METKKCSQSNVAVLAYSCAHVFTHESPNLKNLQANRSGGPGVLGLFFSCLQSQMFWRRAAF